MLSTVDSNKPRAMLNLLPEAAPGTLWSITYSNTNGNATFPETYPILLYENHRDQKVIAHLHRPAVVLVLARPKNATWRAFVTSQGFSGWMMLMFSGGGLLWERVA